jgi:hypothetical protein
VCQDYAVHGRTFVHFNGLQSTIRNGDVGLFPGIPPALTIFSANYPNYVNGGEIYAASEAFADSVTANHASFLAVQAAGVTITAEIGGLTFLPGTYRSAGVTGALNIAVDTFVTLDGNNEPNPTFIFQAPTALTVGANVYFILKNGARIGDVFWALGTAATIGADATLPGSILAGSSITFGKDSELEGCALAQEAVTFENGGYVTSGNYWES